jgi:hypothetical protein
VTLGDGVFMATTIRRVYNSRLANTGLSKGDSCNAVVMEQKAKGEAD